jgi:GT2 family glycosyltransferase
MSDSRSFEGSAPEVSVIIPGHNARSTLRQSLESVFANEGVSYEVIFVNDASTDDTERIALEFPCRVISLRKNIMSANCRNLGARHALSDLLVFFDADQLMEPDTLFKYVRTMREHPEAHAVVGSLSAVTPMPGFFSKFKNLQHHFVHQTANPEGTTLASGLMAIRAGVFREAGGFEPAFSGASIEDIALGYKLVRTGHRIRFQPDIQVVHLKSYTLRQMVRSDILHRAIPWTGLMLREKIVKSDLNTKSSNVASVVLAWLLPIVVALALGTIGFAGAAIVGLTLVAVIAVLNAPFLRACHRYFGTWFLVRSVAFLPAMYFYHGLGLLAGVWAYLTGESVAKKREPPSPDYEVRIGASG